MTSQETDLFDGVLEFPDGRARDRYSALVGLDDVKSRLIKGVTLKLIPARIEAWSQEHYSARITVAKRFLDRSPLFILAGDVGTGKTTLAESFADVIAREEGMHLTLYRLSLSARGRGAVGEMTKLLSSAFQAVKQVAESGRKDEENPTSATVFLIDEADALAQSRELDQMHHEDRAGVNALIRGIDDLGVAGVPAVVLMCTNRFDAIDPAVRRRATDILKFDRPDLAERKEVLHALLADANFTTDEIAAVAEATGEVDGRPWGFTYSDLTQRLMQAALLDAVPDNPLRPARVVEFARTMEPTPPFDNGR